MKVVAALFLLVASQALASHTSLDDIDALAEGDACPKGSFSYTGTHDPNGEGACELCYAGEYSSVEGALEFCEMCPSGQTSLEGAWGCDNCAAGTIAPDEGMAECDQCPEGMFSEEGASICANCLAGFFQDEAGSGSCKSCPAGQYSQTDASKSCEACPAGQSCPEQSSDPNACSDCQPGHFSAEGSACNECPVETYQDDAGATECKPCPTNTDQTGATVCKVSCPAGQTEIEGVCTDCPVGTFETSGSCVPCAAGTYSALTGSTTCETCSAGSFSGEGSTECGLCSAGQFQDKEGAGSCEVCPAGQFSEDEGATACNKCAAGTYNGDSGATTCTACPSGAVAEHEGQVSCQLCEAGSFAASTTQCSLCSIGTYSGEDGATSCRACTAGQYCDAEGLFAPTGPCSAGYYCEEGATNAQESECPAGTFCPAGSAAPATCAPGTYQPAVASTECNSCDAGSYCAEEGLVSPSGSCSAGYFCPSGSSTPTANISPAGHYAPEGSASATPCPASTFNPVEGSADVADCNVCSAGFYCAGSGLVNPTGACNAGYYCPAGSSSATENMSPAGHYASEGSAAPTPCPVSTYNPNTASASSDECLSCPEGKSSAEGSSSIEMCLDQDCSPGWYKDPSKGCIICPKGTFSNIVNAVACRKCPRHQYNSAEGSDQCMKCPDTAYTWEEGTGDFDQCIGPVIKVCSEKDMEGTCYKYYDDNLHLNFTAGSLKVIRGEFELYEKSNFRANFVTVSEADGAQNVEEVIYTMQSLKPILNDVFCYLEQGWKFHGRVRDVSKSGKPCINWKRTPMAGRASPNHYCQNPNGVNLRDKPFCYISETESEECDIPECVWDKDCYTGIGVHYRGETKQTSNGRNCQNWNSDFPHPHGYHSPKYNWAGVGDHNKCRNPDGEGQPWCYTTNLFHRWNYCDIPRCNRDGFEFYRF